MSTQRPTATGTTLAKWSTEELRAELASGWTNINGVDVAAELAWRNAQKVMNAEFKALIDLEEQVRAEQVSVMFGATYEMRHNARRRQAAMRTALYTAVEALSPARMVKFGAYRLAR